MDIHQLVTRKLEGCDTQAFIDFRQETALENGFTMNYPGRVYHPERVSKNFEKAKEDTRIFHMGSFEGDKLVSMIFMRPLTDEIHPWIKHIGYFGMEIRKAYWRKGLGSILLEHLFDFANSNHITKIEGTVRTNNTGAVVFYKKHGFITEGTRKKSALIDGKFLDEYFIAKFL